ncbi:WASH complex subunit 3 [Frankliniella fusca]|uniref:WASH complex subunit 3 n=1 Tax=Frankliniella fusca TaxID=407009 RepID=A0AAE1GUH4_9NEOP|nr:WASH complex subunit 3 [Frankliniella fusca]
MDSDGLPMIGAGVDYTQVGAIHQKRTLAFINYFITNTISFLNNFSRSCEVRLQKFNTKLQRLEACMEILEAKLSSIPALDEVSTVVNQSDGPGVSLERNTTADTTLPQAAITEEVNVGELPQVPDESSGLIRAKDDPTFKKFFKMLQVGVPEAAVKLKMQAEGLDPNVLSNPDQLLQPATKEEAEVLKSEQSDSE